VKCSLLFPPAAVAVLASSVATATTERGANLRIRIVVVDDCASTKSVVALVVGDQPDFELVGQAKGIDDAAAVVSTMSPDVVVMSFDSSKNEVLDTTKKLLAACPGARVVATLWDNGGAAAALLKAGAIAVVLKD
jgi:DNA-binding NarL/FixJ family response regulator